MEYYNGLKKTEVNLCKFKKLLLNLICILKIIINHSDYNLNTII